MRGIEPVSYSRCEHDFDGFARDLGASFRRWGFAVVCDHGLDQAVIDRALERIQFHSELWGSYTAARTAAHP